MIITIRDFQVEEPLTFVSADVRLITIIAEALAAAFCHLSG
jgi:hypothetical protein